MLVVMYQVGFGFGVQFLPQNCRSILIWLFPERIDFGFSKDRQTADYLRDRLQGFANYPFSKLASLDVGLTG